MGDSLPRSSAWSTWQGASCVAACVLGVGTWVVSVAGRLASPHPLEWMEGATLEHALRLARGDTLYAEPAADFIAYLYPPLGYLPTVLATFVLSATLPVARATSVLLFALTCWAVARAARRVAHTALAAPLAVGLWAMGYGYGGGFADTVRVDPTLLCLLAWGAERLGAGRLWSGLLLLALSVFAKQHGLLFLAVGSAWALHIHRRAALAPVGAAVATVGVLGAALQLSSDGWFLTYTWYLPRSHGFVPRLLLGYFGVYVALFLPVLTLASLVELRNGWRAPGAELALLAAGLVVSALGRAHPGGHDNVLMPGYLMLCIVAAGPLARGLVSEVRWQRAAWMAALCVQLAILWQPPSRHWPHPDTTHGLRTLHEALEQCARGRSASALDFTRLTDTVLVHTMALADLRLPGPTPLAMAGTRRLLERLRGPDAPYALAVGASFPALDQVLDERYQLCRRLPRFALPTGYAPEAQRVYRLR